MTYGMYVFVAFLSIYDTHFFYVIVFLIMFDGYSDFLWKWSSWSFEFSVYLHDPSSRLDFGNLHEFERQQYLCKKLNKYVCNHNP